MNAETKERGSAKNWLFKQISFVFETELTVRWRRVMADVILPAT